MAAQKFSAFRFFGAISFTLALVLGLFGMNQSVAETFVQNHSFESGLEYWETNESDAISVQKDDWSAPGGGNYRLDYNFFDSTDINADTFQTITNIENGEYVVSAYVSNSGSFTKNYMYVKSGDETFTKDLPMAEGNWVKVELPIVVEDATLTIGFYAETETAAWQGIDVVAISAGTGDLEQATPEPEGFIKGVDISSLTKVEENGGKFYDDGVEKDAIEIFTDYGANYGRLVLWKDPYESDGYNDLDDTIRKAKRIKEAGMKLLLNFHYSDTWADPGNQDIPKAWENLSFEELVDTVYAYTKDTLAALYNEGIVPDMVQVGNEIRPGMLFPHGKIENDDFRNLAKLLDAGIRGVRDSEEGKDIQIMLHLDQGGDNGAFRWWFDGIISEGVTDFQVIGASYYPYWHGSLDDLANNLEDISDRYDRDVIVVETAYGFTLDDADGHGNIFDAYAETIGGYPATEAGQARFLYDLLEVIKNVPNNRGAGFFYWEPAWLGVKGAGWISGEGNAWENQAMFDFDGNALEALNIFKEGYVAPEAPPREVEDEDDPLIEGLELLSEGKKAEASSSAGDGGGKQNAPQNAVDGDPFTSWGTDEGIGAWWKVDLEEEVALERIRFNFWDGVKEVEISVSADGEDYTSLGTFAVTHNKMDYLLPEGTTARFVRVTITDASSNWVGFMEFLAYGKAEIEDVDTIAPETTTTLTGKLVDGKYVDKVEITFEAHDDDSGVAKIEYSFDAGETWKLYEEPIIVQTIGEHVLFYRAVDYAGNVEETKEITFEVIEQKTDDEVGKDEDIIIDEKDPEEKDGTDNTDDPNDESLADELDDKEAGEPLPNTASFHFNLLLFGLIFLILGGVVLFLLRRKNKFS